MTSIEPTAGPSSSSSNSGFTVKVTDLSHVTDLTPEMEQDTLRLERLCITQDKATSRNDQAYTFLDRQPYLQLSSGFSIPQIGLGTWKSEKGQVRAAVEAAIRAGYRHIDCAYVYENEHEVGEALGNIFEEGLVQRCDLFITGKLWNSSHSHAAVEAACKRSLRDLGLSYLDLYLIHWPVSGVPGPTLTPSYASTWAAIEGLVRSGLVRSIGVSNLSAVKLDRLMAECSIKPAVNQVESHPYFRNEALIRHCGLKGVHTTAYAPLGSPDSAELIKRRFTPSLMQNSLVRSLAAKYNKNVGQILIRWAMQRGTSVLPKSANPERIQSNIDVLGWELDDADFAALSAFDVQVRMVDGSFWLNPAGPYRRLSELWDDPEEDERQDCLLKSMYPNLGGKIDGFPMPTAQLNSGFSMPLIGMGTWKAQPGEVRSAVAAALRMGYRHIDCAYVYENENEVGEAFTEILAEGLVAREEIFVTSKLWNSDHAPDRVEAACRRTLKLLKLDYLDLYLIHWPATGVPGPTLTPSYASTWGAMEGLVRSGLVRSIGVSNLSAVKLDRLMAECSIKPAVNQVESHPYFRNEALIRHCGLKGVHVTAYSPLGSPDSAGIMRRPEGAMGPMQDPVVLQVAAKLGKSAAQILIRWAIQRGTSVLPKSVHPERLRSNLDVLSWSIDQADCDLLSSLTTQTRMVAATFLLNPLGPYKTLEDLWDE